MVAERDRATSVHGEVGKLLRDNPEEEAVRYLVCGDVAMRRGAEAGATALVKSALRARPDGVGRHQPRRLDS